jgi:hypothetical protein
MQKFYKGEVVYNQEGNFTHDSSSLGH